MHSPHDYLDDDDDPTLQGYPPDDEPERERDEWVLNCGYEGCLMPGYHFRHECHNVDDMEAFYKEQETDT